MNTRLISGLSFVLLTIMVLTPACGDDEQPAAPVGSPPRIVMVTWTQDPGCTPGVPGGVTIAIIALDPDTDAGSLTFTGSVTSCGVITADTTVVICPQLAVYPSTATVRDPEGNTDTVSFAFSACQSGLITP